MSLIDCRSEIETQLSKTSFDHPVVELFFLNLLRRLQFDLMSANKRPQSQDMTWKNKIFMEPSQPSEVSSIKKNRSPIYQHAQRMGTIFFKILSEGGVKDCDKAYRFIVSFGLLFNLYIRQDRKPKENFWTFFVSTPMTNSPDPAYAYKSNEMHTSSFKISTNYYKPVEYPLEPFNKIDSYSRFEIDEMTGPTVNMLDYFSLDDFMNVTEKFTIIQFTAAEGHLSLLRTRAIEIRNQLENYSQNLKKIDLTSLI